MQEQSKQLPIPNESLNVPTSKDSGWRLGYPDFNKQGEKPLSQPNRFISTDLQSQLIKFLPNDQDFKSMISELYKPSVDISPEALNHKQNNIIKHILASKKSQLTDPEVSKFMSNILNYYSLNKVSNPEFITDAEFLLNLIRDKTMPLELRTTAADKLVHSSYVQYDEMPGLAKNVVQTLLDNSLEDSKFAAKAGNFVDEFGQVFTSNSSELIDEIKIKEMELKKLLATETDMDTFSNLKYALETVSGIQEQLNVELLLRKAHHETNHILVAYKKNLPFISASIGRKRIKQGNSEYIQHGKLELGKNVRMDDELKIVIAAGATPTALGFAEGYGDKNQDGTDLALMEQISSSYGGISNQASIIEASKILSKIPLEVKNAVASALISKRKLSFQEIDTIIKKTEESLAAGSNKPLATLEQLAKRKTESS